MEGHERNGMDTTNGTNQSVWYYQNINKNLDTVLPLYTLVLLACLVGNAVVCTTILRDAAMRKRRWYLLLINLSVADVGFAFTTMSYIMQLKGADIGNISFTFRLKFYDNDAMIHN